MQTVTTGPAQGSLLLRTGVEGKAAKMGHALTIEVKTWECRAEADGDTPVSVELRAQLPSIEVVKGDGGLKPLSDKDKRNILENALSTLGADKNPEAVFTSTSIEKSPEGWALVGDLTLHGTTQPLTVDVAVNGEGAGRRVTATAWIVQTDFGISPYSKMMGALQVSDQVTVHLEAVVPAS